ncbi:hypothetical protein [Virgibacillus sediminis]|uniref:Uncharacterized protein n=1 Tax=Virgibacillus sediminis TaxID=202260 RepID=A0ABV7A8L5_9BACI
MLFELFLPELVVWNTPLLAVTVVIAFAYYYFQRNLPSHQPSNK